MSQPVQPLPLPYPQVSHIPTSVHSYHPQPQSGFNSMNGTNGLRASAHPAHHFPGVDHESPVDYFEKNQQSACPLKSHSEEKRKGESETSEYRLQHEITGEMSEE